MGVHTLNVDWAVVFFSKDMEEVEAKGTAEFGDSDTDWGVFRLVLLTQLMKSALEGKATTYPRKYASPQPRLSMHDSFKLYIKRFCVLFELSYEFFGIGSHPLGPHPV